MIPKFLAYWGEYNVRYNKIKSLEKLKSKLDIIGDKWDEISDDDCNIL